jgi:hypothetical protein
MSVIDTPGAADAAAELVEALTDAREHLEFARAALTRAGVRDRSVVQHRIDALGRRLRDPAHHLALIGEFSSGKSTLINALLRDPLLISHPLPTTRTITRLRHGAALGLRCRFHGDDVEYIYPASYQAPRLGNRLRKAHPRRPVPADIPGLLDVLTADENVAPTVDTVTIEHPANVLAAGLVLIDTPGTNAEAGHTELARRVLADEADAAVVLVPADNPVGETLSTFLSTALDSGMLSRCVFMVTRMAHVDADEQERLLEVIRRRIRSKLGVADPVLLPVSVGAVVRYLQDRPPQPHEQIWVRSFPDTERELLRIVERRRPIAVSDRVLALLRDLLAGLRAELESEHAALHTEAATLAGSALTDVAAFCQGIRRSTATELAQQRTALQREVDRMVDAFTIKLVDGAVAAVPGPATERRARIEQVVQREVAALGKRSAAAFTKSAADGERLARSVDRSFAAEYARLMPASRVKDRMGVALPALDVPTLTASSLDAVWNMQAEHGSTENMLAGGGAVAGAVIGSMIFPIVGTAVGALLGAGSVLFGAEKREASLREQVRTSTTALAAQVRQAAAQDAGGVAEQCMKLVNDRLTVNRIHYTPLVHAVMADHRSRVDALTRRQAAVAMERAEVERRARLVDERRRRIAAGWR